MGNCAMSRPDTPFSGRWRYYIVVNRAVIGAAVVLAPNLFGGF
jgi:hypothetical protein